MFNLFFPLAHAVTISTAIPGSAPMDANSTPGTFVANFYNFALVIAGILAFGVIVYGGIRYMTSAGNPSATGDAKEWVEAALLGLLLLAGAYFILKVVNPQLVDLNLPTLTPANVASSTPAGGGNQTQNPSCTKCGGTCSFNSCGGGNECSSHLINGQWSGYSCGPIEYQYGGGGASGDF